MGVKWNPFTGELDLTGSSTSGSSTIPQYDNSDKPTLSAGDVWVRRDYSLGGGTPIGLLLALTGGASTPTTYKLKYRTNEATTVEVLLT